MPKLLLSVRSAAEARIALEAGVDLIDIKEPSAGALGAASADVTGEVLRFVDRRCLTSVACGELLHSAVEIVRQLPGSDPGLLTADTRWPDYVKVGLAGCGSIGDWPNKWRKCMALVPPRSAPVAVIYADWRVADAPPPVEVIEQARLVKHCAMLIDTFEKSGPGLLRLCSSDAIRALIDEIHGRKMKVAVAGQLSLDDALAVVQLRPDYIAARGGVCRPDRNGALCAERVARWCAMASHPIEASRPSSNHDRPEWTRLFRRRGGRTNENA